jgi:3-oxoacyl-[acyl-carrier protein] reductase
MSEMRGIAGFTFDKMLHTMPDDAFDIIMKVHVRAPFRLIRAATPYFRVKVMFCADPYSLPA